MHDALTEWADDDANGVSAPTVAHMKREWAEAYATVARAR